MQQELLWAFVLIFAIDSIAPGPAVAMVMSRSASIGLFRTLPFITGLVIGDLALFAMALLGLVALVKAVGPVFFMIKWIGVFYLLYLAYTMWTAKLSDVDCSPSDGGGWQSFFLALFLPLGNPKAVGFYAALLPAFMDVEKLSASSAVNFSLAIVLIWSSVLVLYAAMADQGSRRFKGSKAQKWLNRGSAGAMVGAAGTVAFRN